MILFSWYLSKGAQMLGLGVQPLHLRLQILHCLLQSVLFSLMEQIGPNKLQGLSNSNSCNETVEKFFSSLRLTIFEGSKFAPLNCKNSG